jgi:hypothetical protein
MSETTKRRLLAVEAVAFTTYLWIKVARKLSHAEEELEGTHGWRLLPEGIVALAAVITAVRQTDRAVVRVRRALSTPTPLSG